MSVHIKSAPFKVLSFLSGWTTTVSKSDTHCLVWLFNPHGLTSVESTWGTCSGHTYYSLRILTTPPPPSPQPHQEAMFIPWVLCTLLFVNPTATAHQDLANGACLPLEGLEKPETHFLSPLFHPETGHIMRSWTIHNREIVGRELLENIFKRDTHQPLMTTFRLCCMRIWCLELLQPWQVMISALSLMETNPETASL